MKTIFKLLVISITLASGLSTSSCFGYSEDKAGPTQAKKTTIITVTIEYKEAKPTDTLSLVLNNVIYRSIGYNLGVFPRAGVNKRFRYVIPVKDRCGYWQIVKPITGNLKDNGGNSNKVSLTGSFFWEAGDDIFIQLSNKETYGGIYSYYVFSGKGAEKYVAQDQINSLQTDPVDKPIFDPGYKYSDPSRNAIDTALKVLNEYKGRISSLSFDVIKSDIIGRIFRSELVRIKSYYDQHLKAAPDSTKKTFLDHYKRQLAGNDFKGISVEALAESTGYFKYIHDRLRQESYFKFGSINMDWIFSALVKEPNAKAMDRAIMYLFENNRRSENVELLYSRAKDIIKDRYCLVALNKLTDIASGFKFEAFTLTDTSGKLVDLSMFKGKVIFLDFWIDGCGGCMHFYESALSKVEQEFNVNEDVVFVSISADRKIQKWLEGISSGQFTSKDVVNLYTNGMGADHPMIRRYGISAFPHTILVDKMGIIRYNNTQNLYDWQGLSVAIKELL